MRTLHLNAKKQALFIYLKTSQLLSCQKKKFSFYLFIFFLQRALCRHSKDGAELMKTRLWPRKMCQYLRCSSDHDGAMG